MILKPENVFCRILEMQYNNVIDSIESVINLPMVALRDIKSNISRTERMIYNQIRSEVIRIEKQVLEILFLRGIKDLKNNNFCRVAFSCRKLVDTLVDASNGYLDFLDPDILDDLGSNYDLFERNVCVLGFERMIGSFVDEALAEFRARLLVLRDEMETQLRLSELVTLYNTALNEDLVGSYSIIDLLNQLRDFSNCAFETCNYAATVSNKMADYAEKLALADTGSTFTQDINSLLDGYDDKKTSLESKIDEIVALIDLGAPPLIPRDEIMIF